MKTNIPFIIPAENFPNILPQTGKQQQQKNNPVFRRINFNIRMKYNST